MIFIIMIFWHLKLHYINIIFILQGYRTYLVHPPLDENPYSGNDDFILVIRRNSIIEGEEIIAYRISDTVYMESGGT